MSEARLEQLQRLVDIVDRLRAEDGCPWDREQTLESMVPNTLEEAAEVAEAVAAGSREGSCEELGDLLMNVILMSRIAEQDGSFSLADVAREVSDKLIRRHPHVFEDATAESSAEVLTQWERIKKAEKPGSRPSKMDGVPVELSPLASAGKKVRRAASVGFRWPSAQEAFAKVDEELAELREVATSGPDGHAEREEELGDVLFTLVCLAQHLDVDPDLALRRAHQKFERRFRGVEEELGDPREADLPALLKAWGKVKQAERASAAGGAEPRQS